MIKYSVIIPTYNGAKVILYPLNALLRQTIPSSEYEIIIVDDGSADKTAEVIRSFKKNHRDRNIVYIRKENEGPASARNVGIGRAKGSIIFFTDDDCEPMALWMEKILEVYKKHPDVAGVGGWYTPPLYELKTNLYHQLHYLLYRFYFSWELDFFSGKMERAECDPREKRNLLAVNTGNMSFFKWVFQKAGGFDARFRFPGMEDLEFSERVSQLGFSLYYTQLHILHYKKMNWKRFIKTCAARAAGSKVYSRIKLLNRDCLMPSARQNYKMFKTACDDLEIRHPGFRYDRRILFLALVWFYLRSFLIKWPFFMRPAS